MALYGIYGASGCGRGVLPIAREQLAGQGGENELVFIDDAPGPARVNGHELLDFAASGAPAVMRGNSALRSRPGRRGEIGEALREEDWIFRRYLRPELIWTTFVEARGSSFTVRHADRK